MATMTVTNNSSVTLNRPDTGGLGVSPDAVGGNVRDALPYPFSLNGTLAPSASKSLPVNARDFTTRSQMQQPALPVEEWNLLVQAGTVTVAVAADPNSVDVDDTVIAAL